MTPPEAAAKENPDIDFSIVDFAYDKAPENLKGLTFNTAQPSYLAGYLAAARVGDRQRRHLRRPATSRP